MTTALAKRDGVILHLERARTALAKALDITQVKQVLDVAAAAELYTKQQGCSEHVIGQAHALKIEALARLGELLKDMPKAKGGQPYQKRKKPTDSTTASVETLADLKIEPKVSMVAQQLAGLPPDIRDAIAAREIKLGQALRTQRKQHQREALTRIEPDGLYDTIVIDPPWHYDRQPTDTGMRGEVDYATMTIADLQAMILPAAPDCVLWLWTTNAFMRDAYTLAAAWEFTPKTILTWNKVHMGLGEWLRNVTEHCLLAVRGRPCVTLTNQTTLITEQRREHSRKPEAFYTLVESLCPGRKYEMFARTPREGWAAEGLELGKFAQPLSEVC
jgi:N6-adenosine-specific RNA methylase IME4